MEVSVDRLTIVGFKVDYKITALLNDVTFALINKRYRAQYPYEWRYELLGGGLLEIGDLHDQTNIRLDFNPNSIKEGTQEDSIKKIISCMKYVRPTRVDIAIDVKGIDLNDYIIIDDLSRKYNSWFSGHGRLETHYIGAPTSDLRIRIYDKAKEQGLKDKKIKWWRIESQLRREFAEGYKSFDAFKDITFISKKDINLDHITRFKEKVFIQYLLAFPNDLSKLGQNARYKYKKILKDFAESNSTNVDFHGIYEDNMSNINYIINSYIKCSRINDVF